MIYTHVLFGYLTHRYETRRIEFNSTLEEINTYFAAGIRDFNGVHVNDFGFPMFDLKPPIINNEPANYFLNNYLFWELIVEQ